MYDSTISESATGAKPCAIPLVSLAPAVGRPRTIEARSKGGRPRLTHCQKRHLLTGANLYLAPDGSRSCVTCRKTYEAVRCAHGQDRANQERRDAPGSGKEPRRTNHAIGHSAGNSKGSPWRKAGQFRSHGKATF